MSRYERFGRRHSVPALPPSVTLAAAALHIPVDTITSIGGQSGQSWSCGEHILRLGEVRQLRLEVVAMNAASSVVPVPAVRDMVELPDPSGRPCGALLLERMPGRPAADTAHLSARQVRRVGEACGRLHSRLAAAAVPGEIPSVRLESETARADPSPGVLLHLDLHPLNVLVDDVGAVSGVIDWANAASGPATLDRARTWSILTFDPAAAQLRDSPWGSALIDGWSTAADWDGLPAAGRAWACDFMLNDLAGRTASRELRQARQQLVQTRTVLSS